MEPLIFIDGEKLVSKGILGFLNDFVIPSSSFVSLGVGFCIHTVHSHVIKSNVNSYREGEKCNLPEKMKLARLCLVVQCLSPFQEELFVF